MFEVTFGCDFSRMPVSKDCIPWTKSHLLNQRKPFHTSCSNPRSPCDLPQPLSPPTSQAVMDTNNKFMCYKTGILITLTNPKKPYIKDLVMPCLSVRQQYTYNIPQYTLVHFHSARSWLHQMPWPVSAINNIIFEIKDK